MIQLSKPSPQLLLLWTAKENTRCVSFFLTLIISNKSPLSVFKAICFWLNISVVFQNKNFWCLIPSALSLTISNYYFQPLHGSHRPQLLSCGKHFLQQQQQLLAAWQAPQPAAGHRLPAPLGLWCGYNADAGALLLVTWYPSHSSAQYFEHLSPFQFKPSVSKSHYDF